MSTPSGLARIATVAAIGVLAACTVSAVAQDDREPAPGFLAGPDVGEKSTEPSLVARSLDGDVQPLQAPPAIAALELLELDEATAEKIDALLADRGAVMDTLVLANIELLGQVETIMAVGTPVEKLNMLREGLTALEPVRAWGRLDRRITAALPRSQRAEYREHIDDYEKSRYRTALASGDLDNKLGYRMMRYWEDLGWEIERAAERVFDDDEDGSAWLQRLSTKLDLSPDQQGEIQAMAERFYIETKGRPSEQDEMRFIARIRGVMTIQQRWKFTGMMLRGELEPERMDTDFDD